MSLCENSLISLIMEFCQEEDSSEGEEQQHRIQKNETGNAQPPDILKECVSFLNNSKNIRLT